MFDWAEYLILAEELAERQDNEAALRSSVSRAYYAVFGTARKRLRDEGAHVLETGQAHIEVWNTYASSDQRLRREIGEYGHILRRKRNDADYNDSPKRWPDIAAESVEIARRLLNSLEPPGAPHR